MTSSVGHTAHHKEVIHIDINQTKEDNFVTSFDDVSVLPVTRLPGRANLRSAHQDGAWV